MAQAVKPMTKTQLVAVLAEEMGSDKKTAPLRWTRPATILPLPIPRM